MFCQALTLNSTPRKAYLDRKTSGDATLLERDLNSSVPVVAPKVVPRKTVTVKPAQQTKPNVKKNIVKADEKGVMTRNQRKRAILDLAGERARDKMYGEQQYSR